MKSGFVSIVGRPNVGKSTLLNNIIGHKVAITSDVAGTTRNTIQGIYHDKDKQIVFVDTPGIHKPQHKLGRILNKQAYLSLYDVDVVLFLIDATTKLGKGDMFVLDVLRQTNKSVILVINKIDKLSKEEIMFKINEYKDLYNFDHIVPVSALKKDNIARLLLLIDGYLKDNIKYYDETVITSNTKNFLISEYIREKVFTLTTEEIPHSVACVIEKLEEKKDIVNINAMIVVDRENVKKIIIGKQGIMIKEIGTLARKDIEYLLGKKVFLELYVKVIPKWRDKERYLNKLGFNK
ncbi:MAG: GTPase Era [bacterium]|nr:GTPase Era [bacterium]